MTDQIKQIEALTQIIRDQATLLASMQHYLVVQADVLTTILESNDKVRTRYDQHVIDIIKLQRKLQGEADAESVAQPDNGSSE
jgi:hypothetical protein